MLYSDAVSQLYALGYELHGSPRRKFELGQVRTLVDALGNPQQKFRSILVAGTNGKGSTAATIASILRSAGYRTGLYTSPHLLRINERICLNGIAIPDEEFASAYLRVSDIAKRLVSESRLPNLPSFFETVTSIAFCYFAGSAVQVAVLEVGMGGRLDATNVVDPILSVITDIDLDHQEFLGSTLDEIAREKAGILRARVPAVILPQHPETNDVLGAEIQRIGARAVDASPNIVFDSPAGGALAKRIAGPARFLLNIGKHEIEIDSPLIGRHQHRNLALAITAAEELNVLGFPVSAEAIARGVRDTHWPARFQIIPAKADVPTIVIDAAHNPAGALALRAALSEAFADRPRLMLFGAMRDKAIREMAQILFPTTEMVMLTTTARNPRAVTTRELMRITRDVSQDVEAVDTITEALKRLAERAAEYHDPILILTGSIYIVAEAMSALGVEIQPSRPTSIQ